MKKIILLFALLLSVGSVNAADKLYATFGSLPGGANASLGQYTWSANSSNLMTCFEFSSGKLANYKTLKFTLSNLTGGMVRMGYYVGSTFTEFGTGFGSSGDKTVDLTKLGIDLSTVTKISFGGRTINDGAESGSVSLLNVYLVPTTGDNNLYASFGTPDGSATFYDYVWTATNNNLLPCFEFSSGELANYTKLSFTLSNKADGSGSVRMGYYVGSTFTEFTNPDGKQGFGSTGTKTINLLEQNVDLSTITKISFGGKSETGSINLRTVYLENEALNREFTVGRKSTVCLPFALTTDEVSAAGKFYELTSATSTALTFTEVSTTVAYKPYVFVPSVTTPFASLSKTNVYPVGTCSYTVNGFTFTGVLKSGAVPSGAYGYNSSTGVFSKTTTDAVTIDAFRGYIKATTGNAISFLDCTFDAENVTGITEMKGKEAQQDKRYYNLKGQVVENPTKGLYIVNGKKIVIK